MKNCLLKFFVKKIIVVLLLLLTPSMTNAGYFGVGVYLSSEPDSDKTSIANSMSDLGISITRTTINYSTNIDWAPFDTAINLTRDRGIENLILLHIEGSVPSVDQWGDFVATVANHYSGKIVGYEIMNEADNYISGSNYASYLWRSYDKIKQYDSGAKVVVSGLTARGEATSFWDGIYSGGAWDKFDALGLHPYRDSAPEVVAYNIGDFTTSINIAANTINKYGGGKKIWLTEFGVQSSTVGETNQANYIARSYLMAKSVSAVEKVMMYRYRDGDSWGMVKSDLSHKSLYNLYKNTIKQFDTSGTAERIYVYDTESIDNFDSVSGWGTNASSNGWATLSGTSGHSGNGLKVDFNFNSSNGYIIMEKIKSLSGNPAGLGIWAKGPTTSSVLKLRIKDNNNETFQFDLGKVNTDWTYYKFDFSNDSAKTSWGGNGSIDFPIKFDSIVYDNQGGTWNGTLYLDELTSIKDAADLYAYKLSSKLAYWKLSGSKTITACGKSLTFYEEPQITTVSDCSSGSSSPSSSSSSSSSSPSSSSSSSSTPSEVSSISKEKSKITLDKDKAKADGSDAITISIALKSSSDGVLKSSKLALEVSGSNNTVSSVTLVNKDHYEAKITSTKAEEKDIKVKIGSWELGSIKTTFTAGDFSLAKSTFSVDKSLITLGDSIKATFNPTDANGNEVSTPTWQLIATPVDNVEVTQGADTEIKNTTALFKKSGRYELSILVGTDKLQQKNLVVYVKPKNIDYAKLDASKIITLGGKNQDGISLTGYAKEEFGLNFTDLEGIGDTDKVIVKIESDPVYSWLDKSADLIYQGSIELPNEVGNHKITIYKEDLEGNITILKEGAINILAKETSNLWVILTICGVALVILIGLYWYLVKKGKVKNIFAKKLSINNS